MRLSIIVPVLNEAPNVEGFLEALQRLRQAGHQIIVVDGGSEDGTVCLAKALADVVAVSPRGRAAQMNLGAASAQGEVLLFLHADCVLAERALESIVGALAASGRRWGRFDVRLSGRRPMFRVVETLMNWRSRLTGIATGDQGIFVERRLFEALGGFPTLPLMEDIALSQRLKRFSRPICLKQRIQSSSRRWEEHGVWRTILLMWRLRLAYAFGADPAKLARAYYPNRASS